MVTEMRVRSWRYGTLTYAVLAFWWAQVIPRAWSAAEDSPRLQEISQADGSAATVIPIGMRRGGTEYHVNCSKESDCERAISTICTKGYYPIAWESLVSFDFACRVERPAKQKAIPIFIRPECKWMFYGLDFPEVVANGKTIKAKKRPKPDYVPWNPANATPMAYKDPRSSIVIYVESDGRHIAATDSQGKLLWVRNPWEESHAFCQYRTPRPVVDSLRMAELNDAARSYLKSKGANLDHTFAALSYDSSQFGTLDESTGDFYPGGQN
jgi:hypothetical protein